MEFYASYPSISSLNFEDTLYHKKEFYDLKVPISEPRPAVGQLFNHQKIIARFLSTKTDYNELFLIHEMGTGKSCSAFGTIEASKASMKGAIILVGGDLQVANLKNELINVCTVPGTYSKKDDESDKVIIARRSISFYKFETYKSFTNRLMSMNESSIRSQYNNHFIVIDEAHKVRPTGGKDMIVYTQIHRFLHAVKDCKILLMSGTPMRDLPEDFAPIMNLILPSDRQLPSSSEFAKEYLNDDGTFRSEDKEDKFKGIVRGRISFLRSTRSDVEKRFVGTVLPGFKSFILDSAIMSDFQSIKCMEAFNRDKEQFGIFTNSIQSSLCVYPDGSYGSEGFKRYIDETADFKTDTLVYRLKPAFKNLFSKKTTEEKLDVLRNYSVKYYKVVKSLLDEPSKLHFVYCEFVEGSGAILLSKLLEVFGFNSSTDRDRGNGTRYGLITNKTTSSSETQLILRKFNDPDNYDGKKLRVIIGSAVIGEGFSLKNVQQVHILTPHWNYAPIDQAIARGFRTFSHLVLEQRGISPILVNVHLYTALPNEKNGQMDNSIDYKMYKLSEKKDIKIKRFERVIVEAAVDCALTYDRNSFPEDRTGTRDCNYTTCNYKCDNIPSLTIEDQQLDLSSYNLYYSEEEVERVIDLLKEYARTTQIFTLDEVKRQISSNEYVVITALNKMITLSEPIKTKFGFDSFIKFSDGMFFLTKKLGQIKETPEDVFYIKNTYLKTETDYEQLMQDIEYEDSIQVLEDLSTAKNRKERHNLIDQLPLVIQLQLLKDAIKGDLKGVKSVVIRSVLSYFEESIKRLGETISITLNSTNECINAETLSWEDCESKSAKRGTSGVEEKELQTTSLRRDAESTEGVNVYGYSGIYTKSLKKFSIRDLTKPSKETGKVCKSWNLSELIHIAFVLEVPIPKDKKDDIEVDRKKVEHKNNVHKLNLNIAELDADSMKRLLFWSTNIKIGVLCKAIMKRMSELNILYQL